MENTIYQNVPLSERIEMLKANCHSTEQEQTKVFFSEDDLAEMKSRLAEESIERNSLENDLKDLSAGIRRNIKDKTSKIKSFLVLLKDKYELQMQPVYHFDDQQNGVMLTYNQEGELIGTRKLRPNERQTRIVELNQKTA